MGNKQYLAAVILSEASAASADAESKDPYPAWFRHAAGRLFGSLYHFLMRALALIATILFALALAAQTTPLAVQTSSLPPATVRKAYEQYFRATGGVAPLRWDVSGGTLPPGLVLEPSGELVGIPTTPGTYHFTVRVTDSSRPPRTATRDFVLTIPAALAIVWKQPPRLDKSAIVGQVEVTNHSGQTLDLTVIIVAVNEIGKAFALGYQHYPQPLGSQMIPFGSSLPRGNYVVHADAIGEIADTFTIYRARLQTPQPLVVP